MMLRRKIIFSITVIVVCLVSILFFLSNLVLTKSIEIIEKDIITKNIERIINAFSNEQYTLDTIAGDWAQWNDTYTFVQGKNPEYIANNLMDNTFTNLNINFMIFINTSDQIIYGKAFDLQKNEEIPIPPELIDHLRPGSILLEHPTLNSTISGILIFQQQAVILTSRPILTNYMDGPIQGTLLIGIYLNDEEINEISLTTQLSIQFEFIDNPQLPKDYQQAISLLSEKNPIVVRPLNTTFVVGYTALKDIYGQSGIILRTDSPRSTAILGQNAMIQFLVIFVGVIVVVSCAIVLLVDRIIISRLNRLKKQIKSIGELKDFSSRVKSSGRNDEITLLTQTINEMLQQLQQSQVKLDETHRSLQGSTDALMKKVDELQRFKKVTIEREMKMIELKKRINELAGKVKS